MKKVKLWVKLLLFQHICDPEAVLTNSVSTLTADSGQALDMGAGVWGGSTAGELGKQVFGELGEECWAAAGYQVTQSDDGAFAHSHAWAGQLGQQASQDGAVKAGQGATQPAQTHTHTQTQLNMWKTHSNI